MYYCAKRSVEIKRKSLFRFKSISKTEVIAFLQSLWCSWCTILCSICIYIYIKHVWTIGAIIRLKVLNYTTLHYITLCYVKLRCVAFIILYYIILYYIILYYIILYYIILYYIILYYINKRTSPIFTEIHDDYFCGWNHKHQLICERAMMSKVCLRNAVEAQQGFSSFSTLIRMHGPRPEAAPLFFVL